MSGGPLELSKYSCHILQWQFSIQGAPVSVQKLSEGIAQIKVWDTQKNTKHRLQTLGAFHAHKTLGHIKDPAGTQGEQFRQLLKKNYDITAFCGSAPSHASRHGLTTMRVTFRLLDIHWRVPRYRKITQHRPTQGHVHYYPSLRFQSKHEARNPVWPDALRGRKLPLPLCPARS